MDDIERLKAAAMEHAFLTLAMELDRTHEAPFTLCFIAEYGKVIQNVLNRVGESVTKEHGAVNKSATGYHYLVRR